MKPGKSDEVQYKYIAAALILGIIITAAFNYYIWGRIRREEAYSELYLNEHRNLPAEMEVGRTYNVPFTFSNHELRPVTYAYKVDYTGENYSREVTLQEGESATIILAVTPKEGTWNVTFDVTTERTYLFRGLENSTAGVRSFNISGFGEVFHSNVTLAELETRPLSAYSESAYVGENVTEYMSSNETLKTAGGTLALITHRRAYQALTVKKPFIITVYKEGDKRGEELEVYFWHEVR